MFNGLPKRSITPPTIRVAFVKHWLKVLIFIEWDGVGVLRDWYGFWAPLPGLILFRFIYNTRESLP